jgi:hypothetical protein
MCSEHRGMPPNPESRHGHRCFSPSMWMLFTSIMSPFVPRGDIQSARRLLSPSINQNRKSAMSSKTSSGVTGERKYFDWSLR